MKYRRVSMQVAIFSLGNLASFAKEKPENVKRPNIIWIISDNHSYQTYGHSISKVAPTRNIVSDN